MKLYAGGDNIVIENAIGFPMFQFENTSQGKFMLSVMFGQSKYYVDSLAENTKRGLRQKVRNGIFPGVAPLGYLNNKRTKTIAVDKYNAPIVRQAFEQYAEGDQTLEQIALFFKSKGVVSSGGKVLKEDRVKATLKNPFYYGHFFYGGEVHEGRHKPIVSKALYDKVQAVIEQRSHHYKDKNKTKPLCGLLKCSCGMSITATVKTKTQKNGNVHTWTYYHCSRKSKTVKCVEPEVRTELLESQLAALLVDFTPQAETVAVLNELIVKHETRESKQNLPVCSGLREQLDKLAAQQKLLLDSYLDQDIDRQTFLAKKSELMSEKKTLEENLIRIEHNQNCWVEPMRRWLHRANSIWDLVEKRDLIGQKNVLREIFGLNLLLQGKRVVATRDESNPLPLETVWFALRETNQTLRSQSGKIEKTPVWVPRLGLEPRTN